MKSYTFIFLLAFLLGVVSMLALAQDEDEIVMVPRSSVNQLLTELNRLRTETEKLSARLRLQGCSS